MLAGYHNSIACISGRRVSRSIPDQALRIQTRPTDYDDALVYSL